MIFFPKEAKVIVIERGIGKKRLYILLEVRLYKVCRKNRKGVIPLYPIQYCRNGSKIAAAWKYLSIDMWICLKKIALTEILEWLAEGIRCASGPAFQFPVERAPGAPANVGNAIELCKKCLRSICSSLRLFP